jgi:hypothetical protein
VATLRARGTLGGQRGDLAFQRAAHFHHLHHGVH